jgi:exonuclease III
MKLLLILEQEDIDVFCLQETWIAEGAAPPTLDGFTLVESRRAGSTRGGLAIYVRKPLQIEAQHSNEYGMLLKLLLPNSTRINIINVYIPPYTSLLKRNIK